MARGPASRSAGPGGRVMSAMRLEPDQRWDGSARQETATERLDRNWASLLQELRVTQTGVQLLTGFLLTLPFQQRFTLLDGTVHIVYSATVACSIGATVLLIAPVGMHRLLFRRHRLGTLVSGAHRCAVAGLALLGGALCGVAIVIFNAVFGPLAGWVAGLCVAVALSVFWIALPLISRRANGHNETCAPYPENLRDRGKHDP
jgi:hypothetical protein